MKFKPGRTKGGNPCRRCVAKGVLCHQHRPGGEGKRTSKFDKFDAIKKEQYLQLLGNGFSRSNAAAAVGITRATVWNHRRADTEFAEVESRAEMRAHGLVEGKLFSRAMEGDHTAIIFYLKNRVPERWKDMKTFEVVERLKNQERSAFFRAVEEAGLSAEQMETIVSLLEHGDSVHDEPTIH